MRTAAWLAVWCVTSVVRGQGPAIERDVVFGKGGDVELRMDVCRPKSDGKTRAKPAPVVACVHGGAWIVGHRTMHHGTIRQLAENGYVAVTVQYRLAPKHPWPAQIEDVKCAVRFLRAKAHEWNLDPERIAVLGDSAGGHLSLLAGLADGKGEFEGSGGHASQSSRVACVVNYFGPTDFASWRLPPLGEAILIAGAKKGSVKILEEVFGASERTAPVLKAASPLTYVGPGSPPVLTLQGTADPLVPDQQARVLHAALENARVKNRLELLDGASHGWGGQTRERTNRLTLEFLEQHLRNGPGRK